MSRDNTQIGLNVDPNADAQKNGFVGFDSTVIYSDSILYATGAQFFKKNGARSADIFRNDYTNARARKIAFRLHDGKGLFNTEDETFNDEELQNPEGGSFNPDFDVVSFSYNREIISPDVENTNKDSVDKTHKAPNVVFPNKQDVTEYFPPFKSATSNGGFGNSAEDGTLHGPTVENDIIDSVQVITKYR